MAIRTAHLAPFDFREDPGPASTAIGEGRNVGKLFPDVIELEDHDVYLSAVDTWMAREVLDELLLDAGSLLSDLPHEPGLFPLVVLPIVPSVRLGEAVPTPSLQLRLATPHRRKRLERLHLAAFRARSHEGERADRSLSRE